MPSDPIPIFEFRGTHRQVGQQIGEAMQSRLRRLASGARYGVPPGVSWDDMLLQGQAYLSHSRAAYPQYVDELEGIAEASGLPFEELFYRYLPGPGYSFTGSRHGYQAADGDPVYFDSDTGEIPSA